MRKSFFLITTVLALAASALAGTLTGTVTNGTTGRPAEGDEVILIKLAGGMQEEASTRSDSQGHFTLAVADDSVPHLVRVVHQKAQYHQPAPPGSSRVDVQVFDVAAKLPSVTGSMDLMRMQTDATGLQVTQMYALKNASSPPVTLLNDRTLEVFLPPGAALDSSIAEGPGGMPVRSSPSPMAEKGHYAFNFPLRPGETKFQISYHVPYSGSLNFSPRLMYPMESMAVMLPRSMQFVPAKPGAFEQLLDENGVAVQVARNVPAGLAPAFRVSGTGTVPRDSLNQNDTEAESSGGGSGAAAPANRPGGGLGNPEATPDPLQNYRWYILALAGIILAAGAFWVTNKRPVAVGPPVSAVPGFSAATTANPKPNLLLEAMKEELFQLESERLQEKISPEEYARAKAALDETLARAMRRKS